MINANQLPSGNGEEKAAAETVYDIVVVGGGPAGYIAAIKAARLGGRVAIVEKDTVGGTCLNRGCIPTKNYLKTAEMISHIHALQKRGVNLSDTSFTVDMAKVVAEKNKVVKKLTGGIATLLKSNGVDIVYGHGVVKPDKTVVVNNETVLRTKTVIYAGGSIVSRVKIPGIESPLVLTSDEILDLKELTANLAIIGGGVIGLEMATVFNRLGSKVHVIELEQRILPLMDEDISNLMKKALESQGIKISTSTKLLSIEETQTGLQLNTDKAGAVQCNKALLSIGRCPDLSGLQEIDIELDRGRVKTNRNMQTSVNWIYAPGDVNGQMMLAHVAFKMGEVAAANALGHLEKIDLRHVPSCVYTTPEIGCVGLTEKQAREEHDISIGRFQFSSNGRALASGEGEGFVKIITDKKYGEILGVHMIGPCTAEIVNEAAVLMQMEITAEEIADAIHGHPTYSEAFMEAVADSLGQALHLPKKA